MLLETSNSDRASPCRNLILWQSDHRTAVAICLRGDEVQQILRAERLPLLVKIDAHTINITFTIDRFILGDNGTLHTPHGGCDRTFCNTCDFLTMPHSFLNMV